MSKPRPIDTIIFITFIGGAVCLFLYYTSHNYQLPKPFVGKEVSRRARVYKATRISAGNGGEFLSIRYIYKADENWHTGSGILGRKSGGVSFGDDVAITYDSWFAWNSRLENEIEGSGYFKNEEFYAKTVLGSQKIEVSPSLVLLKKYSKNNTLLDMSVGMVAAQEDSVVVFNWLDVNLMEKEDYVFTMQTDLTDTLFIKSIGYQLSSSGLTYR